MYKVRISIISIVILAVFGGLFNTVLAQGVNSNTMKFGRMLRLIDSYYVDTTDIGSITANAIINVLSDLDPHSVYISKEDVEKMNEPLKGSFEGVGISFNIFRDTLMVLTAISGGPSEKVGLRAGDRILKVDGENIAGIGLKNTDVFRLLRGDKGTKVELNVQRKSHKDLLEFVIIRDKIPIYSLDASYKINEETGYIKLNRFSATTMKEFKDAISSLKVEGIKNLILDLRGNGGGYLKAAIELADQFLDDNKMIVYTKGMNSDRQDYYSSSEGKYEKGKLIILIDRGSASASEIVSGAVQDWDRGLVIGRRSFGKGLVQQPFWLNDGSMIRLTTSYYYTPSGRCIQKPFNDGVEEYKKEFLTRYQSGEMFSEDSVHLDESQVYETLNNRRKVFGGGGVMPDIFVPLDTSVLYKYYNRLIGKNLLYPVVLNYIDNNREALNEKYPDFSTYHSDFKVPEFIIEEIITEGEKNKISPDKASIDFTWPILEKQIRALVARDLFGLSHYYRVFNEDTPVINEALQVLEDQITYDKLLVEK